VKVKGDTACTSWWWNWNRQEQQHQQGHNEKEQQLKQKKEEDEQQQSSRTVLAGCRIMQMEAIRGMMTSSRSRRRRDNDCARSWCCWVLV